MVADPPEAVEPAPEDSRPGIDAEALLSGRVDTAPELVIALVASLGTDVSTIVDDFRVALQAVNYRMEFIRVSELIDDVVSSKIKTQAPTRAEQLMDQGDLLRAAVDHGGAACALALGKVFAQRTAATGSATKERSSVATLIQSLKHPEEVRLLRTVYGPRLIVVSVSASLEQRRSSLENRLRDEHAGNSPEWYAGQAAKLLIRDERDSTKKLGQRVRDAFSQADAFLWIQPGVHAAPEVRRIVDLLFGKPFETPSRDEQGMYFAYAAQLRSAASGRQVGAAIVDTEGELLVTGTNDVPKPGGGQYWTGDSPDHRDYRTGSEANDHHKYLVVQDAIQRLDSAGWLSQELSESNPAALATKALSSGGPLEESRVRDLIEFGRIAHAEMAAISTAARRGTPIQGATLYTTTFPCHECARLIIATGISRVVYVDPYPKSQVFDLYGDQVSTAGGSDGNGRLPFVPFHGVSPRLYPSVFAMGGRHRDPMGRFGTWVPAPRLTTDPGAVSSMIGFEAAVADQMRRRLDEAGWGRSNTRSTDVGGG